MDLEIEAYQNKPAEFIPYHPVFASAAQFLIRFLQSRLSGILIDHVGSTSIPDCGGKGVIDLLVRFDSVSELELIKAELEQAGFQRQKSKDPFPEERPMRTGGFVFEGRYYRTHIHVVHGGSNEVEELIRFKTLLTGNEELRRQYMDLKKEIIRKGVIDSVDYSKEKGSFIRGILEKQDL